MHRGASRAFLACRFTVPQSSRLYRRRCLPCRVNPLPIEPLQHAETPQPIAASLRPAPSASGTCHPQAAWRTGTASAVPVIQLHPVRPFRPEHIDCTRERVGLHGLAHQRRQTLRSLAEVDGLRRHQHVDRTVGPITRRPLRSRRTAATVFASAPRPIRTVTPSISTSILPEVRSTRRVRFPCPPRTARSSNGAATTAGTNCGVSVSLPDAAWRACRRHPNNC